MNSNHMENVLEFSMVALSGKVVRREMAWEETAYCRNVEDAVEGFWREGEAFDPEDAGYPVLEIGFPQLTQAELETLVAVFLGGNHHDYATDRAIATVRVFTSGHGPLRSDVLNLLHHGRCLHWNRRK
jgi:hypothetical protein